MLKVVEIELDKKRKLKFGSMAYVHIEKAIGVPLGKVDFETVEATYATLYGCLKWMDHSLTFENVCDMVDNMVQKKMEDGNKPFDQAYQEVMEYIGGKLEEAMGEQSEAGALPS